MYIKANTGYAESESQNTEIKDESHNYHIGHIIVALFAAELHDTLQPLLNRIHFTDVRPKAWSFYSLNGHFILKSENAVTIYSPQLLPKKLFKMCGTFQL